MNWINKITLKGIAVTLVPLSVLHVKELIEAVKDGNLWELWYTTIPKPENMQSEVERCLDLQNMGLMLPFTVIENATNKVVGMTSYINIDQINKRLEVGSTWYCQTVQRTMLNTECKLLLLTHAFEILNCIAVEFRTNFLNQKSRKAIERIGAKFDGILRNHKIMSNGILRDTCVYSIINSEWPAVKMNLSNKIYYI